MTANETAAVAIATVTVAWPAMVLWLGRSES
jgi:hypothetical protein